ncbi:hypothetical protein AcV5_003559 [Taiwanofungus camphoratus]|nr:hypothetical protein AcV5_003559 [Antrodia cinnamomea]
MFVSRPPLKSDALKSKRHRQHTQAIRWVPAPEDKPREGYMHVPFKRLPQRPAALPPPHSRPINFAAGSSSLHGRFVQEQHDLPVRRERMSQGLRGLGSLPEGSPS